MKSVFADADYWVALLNPQEELNEKAKRVSAQLQPVRIVTSEMVLVEVLNIMGSRGEAIRSKACEAIRRLRENPNVTVVPRFVAASVSRLIFQPGRATDNSPAFQRWGDVAGRNESRQGRQKPFWFHKDFFRP